MPRYFVIKCTLMRTGSKTKRPVGAIVLAAGGSVRMGQPKQLLPIDGQPMVRRVTGVVCEAGLAQVVVVVGAQAEAVTQALDGLPAEIVVNEEWATGLSRSVKVGLGALQPEVQAALLILADQPALTASLLQLLVARYQATQAPIVAPVFQGRRGNPVLFDRVLFPELLAVEGDQGGRAVIARHKDQVESVVVDQAAVLLDVDTQQDCEQAQAEK
jgi:molybdenum cofactor cytidylyltransferase